MSISGYSTLHDPEVQMWKAMRAEYKALKKQEEEERRLREIQKLGPDAETAGREGSNGKDGAGRAFLRRVLGAGKKKKAEANGGSGTKLGKVVDERGGEDGEEWLSDAETEIDMVQALKEETKTKSTSKVRDVRESQEKPERRVEKAPPYVFLQALPGVTVGRRM